jgi:hypothetical protein
MIEELIPVIGLYQTLLLSGHLPYGESVKESNETS